MWLCLYHYYYYYLYDVIMKHVITELKDGNLSCRLESVFFRGTWSTNSIYSKGLKRIYGPKNSRAKQEKQNAILVNLCSQNTASTIRAYAHWRRVLGKEHCARLQSAYVCTLTGRKTSFLNWIQNAWNNCNYSAQSNRVGKKKWELLCEYPSIAEDVLDSAEYARQYMLYIFNITSDIVSTSDRTYVL